MMKKLINRILDKMTEICKSQRKFVAEVLSVILSGRGKMNFRNMSRYSIFSEKTFSRNYKKPFNFAEFNQQALSLVINPGARLIGAFDPSFVKKSGKQTYGKDYFWNGSASKAEKGLEVGLLSVVDVDDNRAYSISARQTPPIAATRSDKDTPITEESRVDAYIEHIAQNKKYLPPEVRYLAVDGFFGKEKFVTGIKKIGLDIVGKLRIDANLRHPFNGQQKQRGRPRIYGAKVNIDELNQLSFVCALENELKLYTAIVYSISLKRDVRIVLVLNETNKEKVGRALLFSTDLILSALEIFCFYKARFQIEFVFRDAKQFTGLADCQACSQVQLDWHFNASFAALNITKIEDRLTQKVDSLKNVFSMASWKARYFNESLIGRIFSMLSIDVSLIKSAPQFEELRNYGTISNFT
jgi:hypothetical protein